VGVPHGGHFRLPLMSKVFTDGGIQNADYTDDNTTVWNTTILTNESGPGWDNRNISFPNCVHNLTEAYLDGFYNATLCVSDDPPLGPVDAGSMAAGGTDIRFFDPPGSLLSKMYPGINNAITDQYQISVDERSRNNGFVELVAPFFMVNAVLDELEFVPDDFFSGPTYFQIEVQL
jgi:hypothetical protein